MPPVSEKQRRLMRAVADNPKLARKVGVSQDVAREFNCKDMGGKLPMRKRKKRK